MSTTADPLRRAGAFGRLLRVLTNVVIGGVLCLWAATSILVLGWLMRRMRFVALRRAGVEAEPPGWLFGSGRSLTRLLGGLAANIREGLLAMVGMALFSAPFAVIWLLSWWAGWENSFSKGYEQAFVGPLLGLAGVAVFCVLMIWFPFAVAHQAIENRAFALFEWRRVQSAVRHSGWGYVLLAATTVVFALPLFAGRGLVAFASNIVPGFDTMTSDDIARLAGGIDLSLAVYIFVALMILRSWAASLYARAALRAMSGSDAALWETSPLVGQTGAQERPWLLTHWSRCMLLCLIWFGLAAQIFIAQFLNHDWHLWVTHPFVMLPWAG
ncbi:MAG: hypothetical protein AAF222_02585 [Pseudomonadota bacterium]